MSAPKVVVLGMVTRLPWPGVLWQTVHYLVGLQRLGCDVYYVEAHGRAPKMFMAAGHDGSIKAAAFIDQIMRRIDFGGRWAFQARHEDGRCYGLSKTQLKKLYRSAALIINLHGGTKPLPEHSATGRLVYVETDPVRRQTELHHGLQETVDFLKQHCALFTFAENYGKRDCGLPVSQRFTFVPTRQPVVLDSWRPARCAGNRFTTIANWKQPGLDVTLGGETYSWSKHCEFVKFLDLPARTGQAFELALSKYDEESKLLLRRKGWRVRDALARCGDLDRYRDYISRSRGEFTVAKDQNVRLRTGWFSDRSATYLAAARPVVTQDTGFGNILPTGEGLVAFSTLDAAVAAVDAINADYARHSAAAAAIAREFFDAGVVLGRLLGDVGLTRPRTHSPRCNGADPTRLGAQPSGGVE
jgi:hypothetical protein